jgi:hypothetical protein
MRVMRVAAGLTGVSIALLCASAALAGLDGGRITQHSIGTATLGLRASDYASRLGERPFVTRYGNGTRRLLFAKAELSVLLGRSGRGIRVTTAGRQYRLSGGLGACSPLASLARSHRLVPYAVPGPFGASAVVYRSGNLWFTLAGTKYVGSVTLATRKPSLPLLVGGAQCSGSDESAESGKK